MNKTTIKSLAVIAIAFLATIVLIALINGCIANKLSVLSYSPYQWVTLMVESNKTKFSGDKVVLNFSYGVTSPPGWPCHVQDGHDFICYGLFFSDGQHSSWQGITGKYSDYRLIDSYYYVKEISHEEFSSDKYSASIPIINLWPFAQTKFNHREAMTVPMEVFARVSGTFVFQVAAISSPEGGGDYYVENLGSIIIGYEYTDEGAILLSDPNTSIPY